MSDCQSHKPETGIRVARLPLDVLSFGDTDDNDFDDESPP